MASNGRREPRTRLISTGSNNYMENIAEEGSQVHLITNKPQIDPRRSSVNKYGKRPSFSLSLSDERSDVFDPPMTYIHNSSGNRHPEQQPFLPNTRHTSVCEGCCCQRYSDPYRKARSYNELDNVINCCRGTHAPSTDKPRTVSSSNSNPDNDSEFQKQANGPSNFVTCKHFKCALLAVLLITAVFNVVLTFLGLKYIFPGLVTDNGCENCDSVNKNIGSMYNNEELRALILNLTSSKPQVIRVPIHEEDIGKPLAAFQKAKQVTSGQGNSPRIQWSNPDGLTIRGKLALLDDDSTIKFEQSGYFYVYSVVTFKDRRNTPTNSDIHGHQIRVAKDQSQRSTVLASAPAIKATTELNTVVYTSTLNNIYHFAEGEQMYIKVDTGPSSDSDVSLNLDNTQLIVYFISM